MGGLNRYWLRDHVKETAPEVAVRLRPQPKRDEDHWYERDRGRRGRSLFHAGDVYFLYRLSQSRLLPKAVSLT